MRPTDEKSIHRAMLESRRHTQAPPTEPLSDAELEAPLDFNDEAADAPTAPAVLPSIGGFRTVRLIGYGGQGAVYEGVQESTDQPVALKVIPGGAGIPTPLRQRFAQEVQSLAKVNHPNVVKVLDRGRTHDGSFFYAMPLVDGRPLDAIAAELRQSPDHPKPILQLFVRMLEALDSVHAAGVIHRDLKPANVLVDRWQQPHLLDFGLARLREQATSSSVAIRGVTLTGQVLGSLPWASPEQARGASDLDLRTDVYSVGLLLYQSLTGQMPYSVTGSIPEVIQSITAAEPARPASHCRNWSLNAAGIDAVVLKAIAKRPSDRYATASEFKRDLERLLEGERPAARHRLARWTRRWQDRFVWAFFILAAAGIVAPSFKQHEPRVVPMAMPTLQNSVGMQLVKLPAGPFMMGSPADETERSNGGEPLHQEVIREPFYIGATEVTRGQLVAVLGPAAGAAGQGDADLPAAGVSYKMALDFCIALSAQEGCTYRLPTEAEWEYACRAGTRLLYGGTGQIASMGWYEANSDNHVHPVTQKSPNHWGLYDMHGNVQEWCLRGSTPIPASAAGNAEHKVRGGSFRQPARYCRSAAVGDAFEGPKDIGFRVVREAAE